MVYFVEFMHQQTDFITKDLDLVKLKRKINLKGKQGELYSKANVELALLQ